jgi:hypothetical protein
MVAVFGWEEMKPYLQQVDQKGILPLKGLIPEIDEIIGENASPIGDPGLQYPEPIEPPQTEKKKQNDKKKALKQIKPKYPACQFCNDQQAEFKDSEKLDLHYVINCLMLSNCNACGQIIEVANMNMHLIKECDKKALYKQCKRCKESIRLEIYQSHIEAEHCLPWKPPSQANRCPLCHENIAPGDRGWKAHLMQKKCTANERNDPKSRALMAQAQNGAAVNQMGEILEDPDENQQEDPAFAQQSLREQD